MEWIEIRLRVNADLVEPLIDVLAQFGYQGVAAEREGIMPDRWDEGELPPAEFFTLRAFIPQDERAAAVQQQVQAALSKFPVDSPAFHKALEQDWAEAWKAHYHPIRIGQRILVRPLWETAALQPDDIEIALDPGMAFGTGTHATTQLCLEGLEALMPADVDVLDLGCGSGILAIAAAKLGARHVFAIDIDPVAIEASAENIEQNGTTDKITLATGGLPEVLAAGVKYDFAVVNILARIIIEMCEQNLVEIVKPGGTAIFSGIIDTQTQDVETALTHAGFLPTGRRQSGDWMLIEAVRPQ